MFSSDGTGSQCQMQFIPPNVPHPLFQDCFQQNRNREARQGLWWKFDKMRKQRKSLPRYPLRGPSLSFLINRSQPAPLLLTEFDSTAECVKSGSIKRADWTNDRPPQSRGSDVRLFHSAFENFSRQFLRTKELVNEEGAAHM